MNIIRYSKMDKSMYESVPFFLCMKWFVNKHEHSLDLN